MASFLDNCDFNATSTGTGDFVVTTAVTGHQTPASANAVNATVYRYYARSADLSQWEQGFGAYTVSGTSLARTTVLFNSSGTASKISFTTVPLVAIVALAEDLLVTTPAAKSDQTTATSNALAVTPLHQQDHDSAAKAWVAFTGSTGAIQSSYGVSGVVRNSAGDYTITFSTAFANANYACLITVENASVSTNTYQRIANGSRTTTTVGIQIYNGSVVATDSVTTFLACYGRQ